MIKCVCEEHQYQKIIYICLNNEICKKLLCEICYQSLQQINSQPKRIIKIELFKHNQSLKNVQKEFVQMLEQKYYLNNLKLDQVILQVKNFFEELTIIQGFEIDIDGFLSITGNDLNFQIINMPEWKKRILLMINQILFAQQEILKTNNQIDIQNLLFSTYQENYNNIILKGPTIFGIQHGNYVRIINGVQKQGYNMYLSHKTGRWREYGIEKKNCLNQMSIQIEYDDKQIIYIKNGQILRLYYRNLSRINYCDYFEPKNILQIKYMNWSGNYKNGKKFGRWHILWGGQNLDVGGEYNQNGVKSGLWTELFENYRNEAKVYFKGQYQDGRKIGQWQIDYIQNENKKTMFCGKYDQDGYKFGEWIELHENFNEFTEFHYVGKYFKGLKKGKWTIMEGIQYNQVIGGGFYNQNGMKIGSWIELHEKFSDLGVIQFGDYHNGKRIGMWNSEISSKINIKYSDFMTNNDKKKESFKEKGKYDEKGQKFGKWIECQNSYFKEYQQDLVQSNIYSGDYKEGVKVGQWDILVESSDNIYQVKGFGLFNSNGMKNGLWILLDKNYKQDDEIVLIGQYQNGRKIGFWKIQHENKTGGGQYDQNGIKQGQWNIIKLLSGNYNLFSLITGEYLNGKRIGRWNQYYDYQHFSSRQQCGGFYDDLGLKTGRWKELKNNNTGGCEVVYEGEYQNGNRVGRWDIFDKYQRYKIGGGVYLWNGIKNGMWIDLDLNFIYRVKRVWEGLYENGLKIGAWQFKEKDLEAIEYKQVGECQYNQLGILIDQQKLDQKNNIFIRKQIKEQANQQQNI